MSGYVLLARHGKAEDGPDDVARRLTEKGREQIQRVASQLKRTGVRVDVIEHSGLVRAAETAELFAKALGVDAVRGQGLTPEANPEPLVRRLLAAGERRIMLVSHAPLLPRLASSLLVGDEDRDVLHFRTGTVACLSLEAGAWQLEWMLSPGIVP